MKKLLLILSVCGTVSAFAQPGYLGTAFGSIVKDAYNECVHTSYFNKDTEGIAECGEAPVSTSDMTPTVSQKSNS